MSRTYTHVQELLPSVLAMKEEGYTYRQIANQFGLAKEQIEELCSRARRKQRRIEKGYVTLVVLQDRAHGGCVAVCRCGCKSQYNNVGLGQNNIVVFPTFLFCPNRFQ